MKEGERGRSVKKNQDTEILNIKERGDWCGDDNITRKWNKRNEKWKEWKWKTNLFRLESVKTQTGKVTSMLFTLYLGGTEDVGTCTQTLNKCKSLCHRLTVCLFFLSRQNPNIWRVYAGILKQSEIKEDTPFFKVEEIIIHPRYTYAQTGYDIALLKLDKPMNFTGM